MCILTDLNHMIKKDTEQLLIYAVFELCHNTTYRHRYRLQYGPAKDHIAPFVQKTTTASMIKQSIPPVRSNQRARSQTTASRDMARREPLRTTFQFLLSCIRVAKRASWRLEVISTALSPVTDNATPSHGRRSLRRRRRNQLCAQE
jgi:hypothetical protein